MKTDDIHIKTTDWARDQAQLSAVRKQVFVEEQQVPLALELDEADATATHFLALTQQGQAVGTARLLANGHVGRMAVLADYRNQGVGSRLLQAVLSYARQQQMPDVYLHAQTSAINFYKKFGFVCRGDIFMDANIPHQTMSLQRDDK
ncbi:MAG: GNAT family N-acetyltransferase [Chromatiales bacterium]|jgi:predicted GNAT family N-acyltransferase